MHNSPPQSPKISVIMSVYNGAEHLAESIDSILAQSFTDFEFIIVNDASTDSTKAIIEGYCVKDTRVRIITNDTNQERSISRNTALQQACADLVAIMDADDWAYPDRLAKQWEYMEQKPEVNVCGAAYSRYEDDSIWQGPASDAAIRAHMIFACPIAHPTVMLRKGILKETHSFYDPSKPVGEDYCLWARLANFPQVTFANMPDVLLRYRTHPKIVRKKYTATQAALTQALHSELLESFRSSPTPENLHKHALCAGARVSHSKKEILQAFLWMQQLYVANAQTHYCDQHALAEEVLQRYTALVDTYMSHEAWKKKYPIYACLQRLWLVLPQAVRDKLAPLKKLVKAVR